MGANAAIPTPEQVAELLEALFGRKVNVSKARAAVTLDGFVALYVDDAGETVGACVCDPMAAAVLGAALTGVPGGTAREMAKSGALSAVVTENLVEVANVGAQLIRPSRGKRVSLGEVRTPADGLPAEVRACLEKPAERLDLEVEVTGYAVGVMALIAAAEREG
jgi:hypothetical protein